MNESLNLEMASITPYGVEIANELLCWLCSAETIQEMTNDEAIETRVSWVDPVGYPDGFTCARCGDVFMPLPENELPEAVECTHDWSYLDEPFAETMICAHCGETQR